MVPTRSKGDLGESTISKQEVSPPPLVTASVYEGNSSRRVAAGVMEGTDRGPHEPGSGLQPGHKLMKTNIKLCRYAATRVEYAQNSCRRSDIPYILLRARSPFVCSYARIEHLETISHQESCGEQHMDIEEEDYIYKKCIHICVKRERPENLLGKNHSRYTRPRFEPRLPHSQQSSTAVEKRLRPCGHRGGSRRLLRHGGSTFPGQEEVLLQQTRLLCSYKPSKTPWPGEVPRHSRLTSGCSDVRCYGQSCYRTHAPDCQSISLGITGTMDINWSTLTVKSEPKEDEEYDIHQEVKLEMECEVDRPIKSPESVKVEVRDYQQPEYIQVPVTIPPIKEELCKSRSLVQDQLLRNRKTLVYVLQENCEVKVSHPHPFSELRHSSDVRMRESAVLNNHISGSGVCCYPPPPVAISKILLVFVINLVSSKCDLPIKSPEVVKVEECDYQQPEYIQVPVTIPPIKEELYANPADLQCPSLLEQYGGTSVQSEEDALKRCKYINHGGTSSSESCKEDEGSNWAKCANHERTQHRGTCSQEGCPKVAQRGGNCVKHGGTQYRKTCEEEGCVKQARGGDNKCVKHGGTNNHRTCKEEGREVNVSHMEGPIIISYAEKKVALDRRRAETDVLNMEGVIIIGHAEKKVVSNRFREGVSVLNMEGASTIRCVKKKGALNRLREEVVAINMEEHIITRPAKKKDVINRLEEEISVLNMEGPSIIRHVKKKGALNRLRKGVAVLHMEGAQMSGSWYSTGYLQVRNNPPLSGVISDAGKSGIVGPKSGTQQDMELALRNNTICTPQLELRTNTKLTTHPLDIGSSAGDWLLATNQHKVVDTRTGLQIYGLTRYSALHGHLPYYQMTEVELLVGIHHRIGRLVGRRVVLLCPAFPLLFTVT
uniref:Uncharacterized protein n=1 Tax=Timema douglasi TaxID=61478 RepID=A0A7R8VRT4_TIMDO|nr:unnamed protein product [Timema douglasi]